MEDYEIIRKLIKTSQFISREDADDLIQDSWVLFTLDTKLTHAKSIQKAMNALRYNKREKSRVIANIPLDNLEPSLFPLGKPRGKMELTCHVCGKLFTQYLSAIRRTKTTCCSRKCKAESQIIET